MQDLKQRELKMQEKRKQTDFREFVKRIASLFPLIFYKNDGHISKYPPMTGREITLAPSKEYLNIADNNTQYGIDYDFTINFFENYRKIHAIAPLPHVIQITTENAEYTGEAAFGVKNVYLSYYVFFDVENVCYSIHVKENCHNIFNGIMIRDNCSNIYSCVGVLRGYNIYYSRYIYNCSDIWFSTNLTGCTHCINCHDLSDMSYCIDNKPYDKQVYMELKAKLLSKKSEFNRYYQDLPRTGNNSLSKNVSGSYIINSIDIQDGYNVYQVNKGKNLLLVGCASGDDENIFDSFIGGSPYAHDYYGVFNSGGSDNVYLSESITSGSQNIYYSNYLVTCSHCIGCVGLRNKHFCILNKEYSKEERFALANKIFAQMDTDGILGEFLPGSLNPFYFNDTIAHLIDDSITKEEVMKEGYLRRDEEIKVDVPEGAEVVYSCHPEGNEGSKGEQGDSSSATHSDNDRKYLSDYQGYDEQGEWRISLDILKKVIKDEKGNYYRIVPMELEFLQKHALPLPELHWLDRIKLGFKFK